MWFVLDRPGTPREARAFLAVITVLLPGADLTPGFLFLSTWTDLRSGVGSIAATGALDDFERAIKAAAPEPIHKGSAAQVAKRSAGISPDRGRQVFREEDADFFAGRKAFADQLLEFTRGKDLVTVPYPRE